MMETVMPLNYEAIARTVILGSRTVQDLARFKEVNSTYAEVVDKYVPRAWANVLTKENLDNAFEKATLYALEQAFRAKVWLDEYKEGRVSDVNLFPRGLPVIDTYPFAKKIMESRSDNDVVVRLAIKYGFANSKDEDGLSQLIYAAREQLLSRVELLIVVDDIDLYVRLPESGTSLINVIINRVYSENRSVYVDPQQLVDIVQMLINLGYRLLDVTLDYACQMGAFEIIELLLDSGVSVGPQTSQPGGEIIYPLNTLLYNMNSWKQERHPQKIKSWYPEFENILRTFLNRGADPNSQLRLNQKRGYARDGITPLMCVRFVGTEDKEIVPGIASTTFELLLAYGADPNIEDSNGDTVLMWANVDYLSRFLYVPGIAIDHQNKKGETALLYSAKLLNGLKLLVDAGANLDVQNQRGETALYLSVLNDKFDSAKLLIDAGADPRIPQKDGTTAFMLSTGTMMKTLYEKWPIDVNFMDNDGNTALSLNILRARGSMVGFLIDNGANVNIGANSKTPLLSMALIAYIELPIVKRLVEAGANVNALDKNGASPLMRAVAMRGEQDYVSYLLEKGADWKYKTTTGANILGGDISENNFTKIADFIGPQAFMELADEVDNTGNTTLMRQIVKIPPDFNYIQPPENISETLKEKRSILRMLLKRGANPTIRNNNGKNALDVFPNNLTLKDLIYEESSWIEKNQPHPVVSALLPKNPFPAKIVDIVRLIENPLISTFSIINRMSRTDYDDVTIAYGFPNRSVRNFGEWRDNVLNEFEEDNYYSANPMTLASIGAPVANKTLKYDGQGRRSPSIALLPIIENSSLSSNLVFSYFDESSIQRLIDAYGLKDNVKSRKWKIKEISIFRDSILFPPGGPQPPQVVQELMPKVGSDIRLNLYELVSRIADPNFESLEIFQDIDVATLRTIAIYYNLTDSIRGKREASLITFFIQWRDNILIQKGLLANNQPAQAAIGPAQAAVGAAQAAVGAAVGVAVVQGVHVVPKIVTILDAKANILNPDVSSVDIFKTDIKAGFTIESLRQLGGMLNVYLPSSYNKADLAKALITRRNKQLDLV